MIAVAPVVAAIVPAARAFHHRVVRYLAAEAGIRQFPDVSAGLATSGRTHEVAQAIDPRCHIVYVSSDPMVPTHAQALMQSAPDGAISSLDADVRDRGAIVTGARAMLDFSRPVAVLLLSLSGCHSTGLSFIADSATAVAAVLALGAAVPSGSYVPLYHPGGDLHPAYPLAIRRRNQLSPHPITPRSHQEVASLTAGLALVPPGVVLDVGRGTGRHGAALAAKGHHADLADASQRQLAQATSRNPWALALHADLSQTGQRPHGEMAQIRWQASVRDNKCPRHSN